MNAFYIKGILPGASERALNKNTRYLQEEASLASLIKAFYGKAMRALSAESGCFNQNKREIPVKSLLKSHHTKTHSFHLSLANNKNDDRMAQSTTRCYGRGQFHKITNVSS